MKSFSKWTIEEVEEEFGIIPHKQSDTLKRWMNVTSQPSREENNILRELSEKLQDRVWDWNKDELKIYFIGPLLNLINFDHGKYRAFFSREISVMYHDEKLSGTVDFVVASGRRSPRHPFLFIHEYKKEHDASDDPLGQLMIAMVTAQKLNNDAHPVYGAYVMGRYWHFTVLDGQSYSVHTGLNATDDDINRIFGVLKNTKGIIENMLGPKETPA